MFLWRLFIADPLMAIALSVCLATIFWCIRIVRKRQKGPDRFLATLLGIASIWQGMRLLRHTGLLTFPGSQIDALAEFTVTALYLISVLILRILITERKNTQVHLRLVESNGPAKMERLLQPRTVSDLILDANPLATIAIDTTGLVVYWNSAAERLLGWTATEMLGKTATGMLTSPLPTKSGANIPVESWVSALQDAFGRPCGTVIMIAPLRAPEESSPALRPPFPVDLLAPAPGR